MFRQHIRFAGLGMIAGLVAFVVAAHAAPALTREADIGMHEIRIDSSVFKVRFTRPAGEDARSRMLDWVRKSAHAVAVYYGRFPVESMTIFISPYEGRGVRGGRAWGGLRPRISISAGTLNTAGDFDDDWRMVHEMIHMAFPMLDERHDWMTEGLAVYVESVARLQASHLDEKTVWKGFIDGMRNGLPLAGDRGLDHTPTWGRTYWGGALFCLVADLEIRRRTDGAKSLQDALRAVVNSGGNHNSHWPLENALKTADEATGTTVLMDLYRKWGATAVDPKLPELWKRLGVIAQGQSVSFDDDAELAKTRKSIGRPPKS